MKIKSFSFFATNSNFLVVQIAMMQMMKMAMMQMMKMMQMAMIQIMKMAMMQMAMAELVNTLS